MSSYWEMLHVLRLRNANTEGFQYCEYCEMWLNGPTQWEDHKIGKNTRKTCGVRARSRPSEPRRPSKGLTKSSCSLRCPTHGKVMAAVLLSSRGKDQACCWHPACSSSHFSSRIFSSKMVSESIASFFDLARPPHKQDVVDKLAATLYEDILACQGTATQAGVKIGQRVKGGGPQALGHRPQALSNSRNRGKS